MTTVREGVAYARAAEVGQRATRRRRLGPIHTMLIERDPVPGSPFWYWRVFADGRCVADGWRASWELAHRRANAEIVARQVFR